MRYRGRYRLVEAVQFNRDSPVTPADIPAWFTNAIALGIIKPEFAPDSSEVVSLFLSTVKALEVVRDHDWVIRDSHTHVLEVCANETFKQRYKLQL